jgi:hypothetical protein
VRYFTRGWANGEGDYEEWERAGQGYRNRLAVIAPRLPEPARRLAHEVSLHDAIIEDIEWTPSAKKLVVTLATGTSESGYLTVSLTYLGAELGERRVEALRSLARDRETEVLYDEVDMGDDGLLVHRLLFWPQEEVTIDFRELQLHVEPRADRRVHVGVRAFREVTESD